MKSLMYTMAGIMVYVMLVLFDENIFGTGVGSVVRIAVAIILTAIGVIGTLIGDGGVVKKGIFLVLHAGLWIVGPTLVMSLLPVFLIIFLLFLAYVAYGDEGGGGRSSYSGSSGSNPMKDYEEEHNFSNMPTCIWDDSNEQWNKQYAYDNCAVYRDSNGNEDTVTYCDIKSCYATGYSHSFHWY